MTRKIILDCDPGHDDAIAIILALGTPGIDVLGITTVGGNQTLEKVTRNALSVLRVCRDTDLRVYPGCARPLVRQPEVAPSIHGESGLDGVELPEPAGPPQDEHAVDYIIRTVMEHEPNTVTLVPTGPLTNIALAVRREPRIVERVREVVLMGGGYHTGNWSATAEFNIKVDPESAHIVFNEPWPLTMVGLDLTHQALATPEVEEQIRAIGSDCGGFVLGLLDFFRQSYRANQGFEHPPVHDACAVAYLIDSSVVTTRRVPLDVELRGELTVGMTVADFRMPAPENCTTQVAVDLDHGKFWHMVTEAIARVS